MDRDPVAELQKIRAVYAQVEKDTKGTLFPKDEPLPVAVYGQTRKIFRRRYAQRNAALIEVLQSSTKLIEQGELK